MSKKRIRLFHGWLIVLVCADGLFLGAPLMVFSFSVFFKSLVLDFHASRAAVSLAFSLFNIVGALWLPGTGMLIDRFGGKRVILGSSLVYGLVLGSALSVGSRHLAALSFVLHSGNCHGQWPGNRSLMGS